MPAQPQGNILPMVDPTTVALPPVGSISLVVNLSGQLTVIQSNGTITPINPTNQISDPVVVNSAAAGNTNVGPGIGLLNVIVNVTGGASVRTISLSVLGLTAANAGDEIDVLYLFPGPIIAGVGLQVYDANPSGAQLFNFTTDGIQASAIGHFYFDGAAWQVKETKVPAIT